MQCDILADRNIKEEKEAERERIMYEAATIIAQRNELRDALNFYEDHHVRSFLRHMKRRASLSTTEFVVSSILAIICLLLLVFADHGLVNVMYTAFIMAYTALTTVVVVELSIKTQEMVIAVEQKNLEYINVSEKLIGLNLSLGYSFSETNDTIGKLSQKIRNPFPM